MADPQIEIWGFHTEDVESVRQLVERTLGVSLTLHESETIGPYYFTPFCESHAELTLRPNLDPAFDPDTDDEDEEFAEPDFPDYGVVLYAEWHVPSHTCRERFQTLGGEGQLLLVESSAD